MTQTGILYIVATPIGNMEDITLRALRIFSEVDIVLAEDTRVSGKLLAYHNIPKKQFMRFDAHAKEAAYAKVGSMLDEGKNLAFISDAGTPGISDPGVELVAWVRANTDATVVPIPGASALTTALSGSGIPSAHVEYLGFLPHKKGRETIFNKMVTTEHTIVFYESPHRLLKTLASIEKYMPARGICIAKELTKIHERFIYGTATEVLEIYEQHPDYIKGEFVVIVRPL